MLKTFLVLLFCVTVHGDLGQGLGSRQGLGQGYNRNQDQTVGFGNTQGLGQGYGNGNQVGQGFGNSGYHQDGYAGLGQHQNNGYSGLGQGQQGIDRAAITSNDNNRFQNRNYDDNAGLSPIPLNQQPSGGRYRRSLGQEVGKQGIGQEVGKQGIGQEVAKQGIGQGTQPGVGRGLGQEVSQAILEKPEGGLSGSLRLKRYVEREPYRKTCNSYYGKFICYRLYDEDSAIPNDFTCWSVYTGKKNCTETENILYLDRRNVEVDPSELERHFDTVNSRSSSNLDSSRRDRYRQGDDEFGAVEKNLHNRRNNDRELPRDSQYLPPLPENQRSSARVYQDDAD